MDPATPVANGAGPIGHLIVRIEEANGKNNKDEYMWEAEQFEGWVKGKPAAGCVGLTCGFGTC
jgi:hypothetical protein